MGWINVDEKECTKCHEVKPIEMFGNLKKGDKVYKRNVCKSCHNKQSSKSKGYKPRNINTENAIVRQVERVSNIFTSDEVKIIKEMINMYPDVKSIIDNKIVFEKDVNKRIKKTVLINDFIHNVIEKKCIETNLNYSDVVNQLLKKGIEYI